MKKKILKQLIEFLPNYEGNEIILKRMKELIQKKIIFNGNTFSKVHWVTICIIIGIFREIKLNRILIETDYIEMRTQIYLTLKLGDMS